MAALCAAAPASAFTIEIDNTDFTATPVFNNVTSFSFTIEVAGPIAPGVYSNPALVSVDYFVNGVLTSPTPSGFPAFGLVRSMTGIEFYNQGSSLQFEIAPGADLSDGLQFNELAGTDPVFVLNAREVGTGRYHPPLFELYSNGTGQLRNSNNTGGVNPATNQVVDVNIGDEYIIDLAFSPTAFTLSDATPVPEPTTGITLGAALLLAGVWRKRRQGN